METGIDNQTSRPNTAGREPTDFHQRRRPDSVRIFPPAMGVLFVADLCRYKHPYEHEITNLQYPSQVFESREPIKYLPVEKTAAIWVDTYEGVLEMLEELKKATEIAIDLEHHDFRTYNGLLSLMQISTREKDWIVDTLVPWRHKLEVLNEVFADPKIIKVGTLVELNEPYEANELRSFTAPSWTPFGFKGISGCMSWDSLTPSMPARPSGTRAGVWRSF